MILSSLVMSNVYPSGPVLPVGHCEQNHAEKCLYMFLQEMTLYGQQYVRRV